MLFLIPAQLHFVISSAARNLLSAGATQKQFIELSLDRFATVDIPLAVLLVEPIPKLQERPTVVRFRSLSEQLAGESLERRAHHVDRTNLRIRQRGNDWANIRPDGDETLGFQLSQRFANDRAGNAVGLRKAAARIFVRLKRPLVSRRRLKSSGKLSVDVSVTTRMQ